MSDPIMMICSISGCSEEEAKKVFQETEDVVDAIDKLIEKKPMNYEKYIPAKPTQILTEEQIEIRKVRELMKKLDDKMSTSLDQPGCVEPNVQQVLREEMALQNNDSQQCQLLSQESEVQIPEIVYQ